MTDLPYSSAADWRMMKEWSSPGGRHVYSQISIFFHTGLNLFVLINILSQLIVPFSEMYSAVLEKADHPLSSAVHEFWTVFFGRKVWSSSEISIIQFSSGGLFKTKEPFWNFVCLLMPWFNPICVDLCKYAYELVEKTFLSYDFGKGQYTFYPVKLSRFLEKK